jgi:serine/threonine-protein kinase
MGDERNQSGSWDERVDRVVAAYLEAEQAGQAVDREELLRQHPDLARELRSFFADRDFFRCRAEPIGPAAPASDTVAQPAAAKDSLAPGQTVTFKAGATLAPAAGTKMGDFGDYELLEEIARGGMGVVYKARQTSPPRLLPAAAYPPA